MSNLDEPNGAPAGGTEPNADALAPTRVGLEQRVRELERENDALRGELSALRELHKKDRDALRAMIVWDLPQTADEYKEFAENAQPLSDLIREMERKHGLESPK